MEAKFYNTTNLKGEELKEAKDKNISQDRALLSKLKTFEQWGIFSAWICFNKSYLHSSVPVYSYRRTLNSLEANGKIEKVGRRMGDLNRTENTYKLI